MFSIDPGTGSETTLHTFTGLLDGGYPSAGLSVANGVLYGTARGGGAYGGGTLFSIQPARSATSMLHAFSGQNGTPIPGLSGGGDLLFGVAGDGGPAGAGIAFKIDDATDQAGTLFRFTGGATGVSPNAALVKLNGVFYGTTSYGGAAGAGTVFSIDPATGTQAIVYAFKGGTDGQSPGNLMALGDRLYGTTGYSGIDTPGTVFRVNPATGGKTTILAFTGPGGFESNSGTPNSLVALGKSLYGTTYNGGFGRLGSIFQLDPATGAIVLLHSFACSDGCFPAAAMIAVNGTLYGTTSLGGQTGGGTIFAINPVSGDLATLYHFGAVQPDGAYPEAALLGTGGLLYGTTSSGGANGGGTVFQFDPSSLTETILYSFGIGNVGNAPAAPLIDIGGTFYGTTSAGGANNAGTVFSLSP